ncbi:MAG: hypothetical protein SGJ04_10490 [Bacteroidota bacterium]|nr:hypothetical protein [Bacteroidota bacterium]
MIQVYNTLLALVANNVFPYAMRPDSGTLAELNRVVNDDAETGLIWLSTLPEHWQIGVSATNRQSSFRLYIVWPIGVQASNIKILNYTEAALHTTESLLEYWQDGEYSVKLGEARAKPVARMCASGYCGVSVNVIVTSPTMPCTQSPIDLTQL